MFFISEAFLNYYNISYFCKSMECIDRVDTYSDRVTVLQKKPKTTGVVI